MADWTCKYSVSGHCGRCGRGHLTRFVDCNGKAGDRIHCPAWNSIDPNQLGSVIAHALSGIYIPEEVEP